MTWKEIKTKIESYGVVDNDEVSYIDISSDLSTANDIEYTKKYPDIGWEIVN